VAYSKKYVKRLELFSRLDYQAISAPPELKMNNFLLRDLATFFQRLSSATALSLCARMINDFIQGYGT
jgi:hypothetical protein